MTPTPTPTPSPFTATGWTRLRRQAKSAATFAHAQLAGLIPEPLGEMSDEYRQAIDERVELIEARVHTLATAAVDAGAPWARRLGKAPTQSRARKSRLVAAATVAAYRDRHQVESDLPTGGGSSNDARRTDRRRAYSPRALLLPERDEVRLDGVLAPLHGLRVVVAQRGAAAVVRLAP